MTISNDSPTKEITMKKKISTGADISKQMIQNATLGAIFLTVFGLFSSVGGYLKGDIVSWQDYVLLVTPIVVFILGLTSLVLLRRGKSLQGSSLVFIANLMLPIVAILLQTGLGWAVFVYALVSSIILIWLAMPKVTRSWTVILTALSLALIAAMEWFNPSTRVSAGDELSTFFYGASAILVAIFFVQSARQAWGGSLRTKFLTSFLSTIVLAIAALTVFSVYSSSQSQAFIFDQLETAVRSQSRLQIKDTTFAATLEAEETLSEMVEEVGKLAEYHGALYAQSSVLELGNYWDANTRLTKLPGGQYDNPDSDIASVFIPSTIVLDEAMIANINTGIYLDFTVPTILQSNPNIVAIYFIGTDGSTIYYPNINLAEVVTPDFDPRLRPFYSIATPENNPERKVVWTEPYQDAAGNGLLVTASAPVYDQAGKFRGVVAVDVQLIDISTNVAEIEVGESGFAFLVDSSGRLIGMPEAGYKFFNLTPEIVPVDETPTQTILGVGSVDLQEISRKMTAGETGLEIITVQGEEYYVSYAPLSSLDYSLGVVAPVAELDVPFLTARDQVQSNTQDSNRVFFIILVVILLAATGAGLLLSQFLSGPIVRLTSVAEQVAAGDLSAQARVESADETGKLAGVFNRMTSQLREFIGTLEARVTERTRNLELAAEVGRTVSQVRALDVMLKDAAELIRTQFDLYYVQVYLADASQTDLILQSGTGKVGEELINRKHSLPLNTNSINGRAAVEKRSVVISDTTASATFKPNPLLPNTRSEMAVPLMVGDRVVGVLDMQSETAGALSEDSLSAFEALAGQLAIAIQNANLLTEAEQSRAEVESLARRLTRTAWNEYLDAVHKPEKIGYTFANDQIVPLTDGDGYPESAIDDNVLAAPITVTGETLGALAVEMDEQERSTQAEYLTFAVARQVAQHIENLRLLDSAERFRYEAEQATRRLTHEGWQEYMVENTDKDLEYIYDLNEVRPLRQGEEKQVEESGISLPLKVRDETVGKLVVKDVKDEEAVGLVNAVAERLSAHIEGLRLSMQTEKALASSKKQAQREQSLRQITSAVRSSTDPAVILRTAARELGNILGRQTVVRLADTVEEKTGQADHPAEIAGENIANNGHESVSSTDRS